MIFSYLVLPHFDCAEVFTDEVQGGPECLTVAKHFLSIREGRAAFDDVPRMLGEGDVPTRADPFEGRTDVETLSQYIFDLVLTFLPNFTSSLNTTDTEMVTKTLDIHVVDTNLHSLQLGLKSSFFLV